MASGSLGAGRRTPTRETAPIFTPEEARHLLVGKGCSMPKAASGGDPGPLERLCGDEAELERSLLEARREAAATIATARGEAERIAAEARASLEQALAQAREGAGGEEARESDAIRRETAEAVAEVARRAELNGARVLERLVEIVLRRSA